MNAIVSSSAVPAVFDVIDRLVGIEPGSHLDRIRAHREQARTHAQQSYLALFAPTPPVFGHFEVADRFAVAAFVAGLHGQAEVARFYADALVEKGARAGVAQFGLGNDFSNLVHAAITIGSSPASKVW